MQSADELVADNLSTKQLFTYAFVLNIHNDSPSVYFRFHLKQLIGNLLVICFVLKNSPSFNPQCTFPEGKRIFL